MKAVPFIETMLNEKYRIHVFKHFKIEDIINNFGDWYIKDMGGWSKYVNPNTKSTIEFYGEGNAYKIKNPTLNGDKVFNFPFPKNLDQFICDCERCFVDLHWKIDILNKMNRIVFMKQSEIEDYNKNLLIKIEKG